MGSISVQCRNGETVGYSVYLGVDEKGQKLRRFFSKQIDAERFLREKDQSPLPIGELWDRRSEILYNLDRLRSKGADLTEVVSLFLNQSSQSDLTLSELLERFLEEKRQIGRSENYENRMRYGLGRFIDYVGQDRLARSITRQEVSNYVYQENKHTSPVTKKNLLADISILFGFAVREDLIKTNPVEKITRPTIPFKKPSVLSPADFGILLRRCLDKGWSDRLTVFVLVGFCGVRVEEVSRLTWSNIDLRRKIVEVPATVAKKASFRNNPIPPNALRWLEEVEDKRRRGPIIGKNWKNLLRSAVRFSHIRYSKNCIRHSFCSYGLASGWSLSDIVSCMGHGGGTSMVFSHYRNVVSPEDGKRWFDLVP